MNVVAIIGNLARDPEVRYGRDNLAIAKMAVAVGRTPTASNPEPGADFINVTVFGKQAENVEKYLRKGNKVAVNGRIQTGSYDNKEGRKVYTTDIIADRVEFLTPRGEGAGTNRRNNSNEDIENPWGASNATVTPDAFSTFDDDDDESDVPF